MTWGVLSLFTTASLLPADNPTYVRQNQHLPQSLGGLVWAPIPFKRYQVTSGYDTRYSVIDIELKWVNRSIKSPNGFTNFNINHLATWLKADEISQNR